MCIEFKISILQLKIYFSGRVDKTRHVLLWIWKEVLANGDVSNNVSTLLPTYVCTHGMNSWAWFLTGLTHKVAKRVRIRQWRVYLFQKSIIQLKKKKYTQGTTRLTYLLPCFVFKGFFIHKPYFISASNNFTIIWWHERGSWSYREWFVGLANHFVEYISFYPCHKL